ncbi:TraB/GumN family protein [Candidatus Parabeggiatoa sp. HSG14]|uniref:TraB/GumN family protein n=1 Tax=Candidatus Parabeggiatoa sp. HSG14 TaxID=3055593 RepID=UPI0025A7719C|nr:TraB/GumN family protein [Thiotrichales bacterium HSG14]
MLFVILAINSSFADAQKGLLWQIDKPGLTSSYLLGTIHSEEPRIKQVLSAIHPRFKKAKSITLEMQMDTPTIRKLTQAMFFVGGKSLEQVIGKSLYAQVVKALNKYGMPPMMAKTLKPWAVIAILSTPIPKTGEFMDLLLYKKAMKLQKTVHGLEEMEEQLAVFEDL